MALRTTAFLPSASGDGFAARRPPADDPGMTYRLLIDGVAERCPMCEVTVRPEAVLRIDADQGRGRLLVKCEGGKCSPCVLTLEDTGAGVMVAAYLRPADAAVVLLREAAKSRERAEDSEAKAAKAAKRRRRRRPDAHVPAWTMRWAKHCREEADQMEAEAGRLYEAADPGMTHRLLIDGFAVLCPMCRDSVLRIDADQGRGRLLVKCEGGKCSPCVLTLEDTGAGVMVAAYLRPADAAVALLREAAKSREQAEDLEAKAAKRRRIRRRAAPDAQYHVPTAEALSRAELWEDMAARARERADRAEAEAERLYEAADAAERAIPPDEG